jgi:hypothetical protein
MEQESSSKPSQVKARVFLPFAPSRHVQGGHNALPPAPLGRPPLSQRCRRAPSPPREGSPVAILVSFPGSNSLAPHTQFPKPSSR